VLDLRAPLVDVLPPERRPSALTAEHTLHHLLSHTSGLANYSDDDDETWAAWNANWDRMPVYQARRPADLVPLFTDLPVVAAPGAEQRYCDANFVLVGLAIEAATSRPYDQVTAELVLEPAGMSDIDFAHLDTEPAHLATG
jgi:CubicO group peptidase (beta-lactamase class C family)